MTGEFKIISEFFAPLTDGCPDAYGLTDDAALLPSSGFVVTKDLLVEGVHFLAKDPADQIARKALRVNLSDLAAKGAKPVGYFLGCVWPLGIKDETIAAFARGLREDQDQFKFSLLGGDTAVHKVKVAPLTISLTMVGAAGRGGMILRKGAAPGDDVYVTGCIGDAGLGLAILTKQEKAPPAARAYLAERYRLPTPRVAFGGALSGVASAAIDVSDGLVADAGHLCANSEVGVEIMADRIPLSPAATAWADAADNRMAAIARLASAGDDYEILFTAAPARRRSIEMTGQVTKTKVTRIGQTTKDKGVRLLDETGGKINLAVKGYDHFSR